jgi:hypothetical protein
VNAASITSVVLRDVTLHICLVRTFMRNFFAITEIEVDTCFSA